MRLKFIALLAAFALLGACESTSENGDGTAGTGTSGTSGSDVTTSGVDEPTPGSQEDLMVEVGDRVFFDFDSSELDSEGQATLEKLAAWLRNYPRVTLRVEGHCDERGTREYNLALGERRASSVRDYLMALGIDPNRLSTISYGEERPAVLGSNDVAWAQNRRAVFVVG